MTDAEAGLLHGIKVYFDEILAAVDKGLFRLALMGAVTIPDVMAALGSERGETSGAAYQQWFDDNARDLFNDPALSDPRVADLMAQLPSRVVRKREDVLTGEACYRFRCALLHQARSGHPQGLARVVFVEPGTTGTTWHMNSYHQGGKVILNIDLPIFCETMVEAAVGWLRRHANDPNVLRNLAEVVRRYPEGGRFISGVPVIM